MTHSGGDQVTLSTLDHATRLLVRLSAVITAGTDPDRRAIMAEVSPVVPAIWVEEVLLQTYLFAGFPRAINAMRDWRREHPVVRRDGAGVVDTDAWRDAGERTCTAVYGASYHRLRANIRNLHPLLDEWMIVEGYGKVLSRSGLDLGRRELCIVAACAAAGQDRQLHSHLHGARNAGVATDVISAAIDALGGLVPPERITAARLLWTRVQGT